MPRSYWSGQLQISLVSFGVNFYVATESKAQISFRQISRSTGERVRHQKVLESAVEERNHPVEARNDILEPRNAVLESRGNAVSARNIVFEPKREEIPDIVRQEVVRQDEIVKGFEYSKGQYVIIEPSELEQLRVPSKHVIAIDQFIDRSELDPEYVEKPYFVTPENDIQAEAFAVVRQALVNTSKMAIGRVAFSGREHVVAIAPSEPRGMMAYTLRYPSELRSHKDYFENIKQVEIKKEELELAESLINKKAAKFDPEKFVDGYEVAVKELVNAKLNNLPIPKDEAPTVRSGKVINLMDALRKSLESDTPKSAKKPVASEKREGIGLVKAKKATAKRKSA